MSRPVRITLWTLPAVVLLGLLLWLLLRPGSTEPSTAASPEPSATRSATSAPTTPAPDETGEPGTTATAPGSAVQTPAPPADPPTDEGVQAGSDVGVVVTSAGTYEGAVEVVGYVETIEDGGTCTVTLTSGGTSVTASQAAAADASTTSCGLIRLTDPRLGAGSWSGTLTYDSPTAHGVSTPFTVQIG